MGTQSADAVVAGRLVRRKARGTGNSRRSHKPYAGRPDGALTVGVFCVRQEPMKNTLLLLGFVICAILGLLLMQMPEKLLAARGPWQPGGPHINNVEFAVRSVVDKCMIERVQGRLKGHAESIKCSNPALRAAFEKEGFPQMEKLDVYLASRVEWAAKADSGEITEDDLRSELDDGLAKLLLGVGK